MQLKKFKKLSEKIMQEVMQTREEGQKEYARTHSDVFANFKRVAADLDTSVLLGSFSVHVPSLMSMEIHSL